MGKALGWRLRRLTEGLPALGARVSGTVVPWGALWALVVALAAVRLALILQAPPFLEGLAPDEAGFARLVAAEANTSTTSSYFRGLALILPAQLLDRFGLSPLTSVRLVSCVYALGSQSMILAFAIAARRYWSPGRAHGLRLLSMPFVGFLAYVLLPSGLLWGTLGLRETAAQFWVLCGVMCCLVLWQSQARRYRLVAGVTICVAIGMTFASRSYFGVALVIALASAMIWRRQGRWTFSMWLGAFLVVGVVIGGTAHSGVGIVRALSDEDVAQAAISSLLERELLSTVASRQLAEQSGEVRQQATAYREAEALVDSSEGDLAAGLAQVSLVGGRGARAVEEALLEARASADPRDYLFQRSLELESAAASLHDRSLALIDKSVDMREATASWVAFQESTYAGKRFRALALAAGDVASAFDPREYLQSASSTRARQTADAGSAFVYEACSPESALSGVGLLGCEMARLPVTIPTVLFRPIWPVDGGTSLSVAKRMATVENFLWLGIALLALFALVARRMAFTRVLWIALVWGALLLLGMAVLEGNFGTAFRHKYGLWWVLCLVLVMSGPLRAAGLGGNEGRCLGVTDRASPRETMLSA